MRGQAPKAIARNGSAALNPVIKDTHWSVSSGSLQRLFVWAHVRRDFLNVAEKYSDLEGWAFAWIEESRKLYELCKTRAEKLEECSEDNPEFCFEAKVEIVANKEQKALEKQVRQMEERWSNELEELEKEPPSEQSKPKASIKVKEKRQRQRDLAHQEEKAKVLRSLRRHWCGLTLCQNYPDIPLDNNAGERALRGAAVGRKNYYGSGARWSIRLTENLFSLFATLGQCNINVRNWLSHYLEFCAKKRGKIPSKEELKEWLPWNMTEEQREKMSQSLAMPPPPAAEAQARAG
jgi:transposase